VRSRTITSSICLFCEDIRHEQSGVATLVGVLPDNLNVPATPVVLPKLAMYIRVVFPLSKIPNKISAHLQASWFPEPAKLGEVTSEQIAAAVDETRAQDGDAVRFNFNIIGATFAVPSPGKVIVITSIDNMNIQAGTLTFRVQQPST
jgi:hypothetical protein